MDETVIIQELSNKISDVPLAENLKRRSISADPELEEGEIPHKEMPLNEGENCNSSHKAGAVIEEGNAGEPLVAEGQNGKSILENDGAVDQWWMRSKVYPPPKRRSVSAIRRYPPGCGRNLGFTVAGFDSKRVQCKKVNGNSEEVGEADVMGSVNRFRHIADEHAKNESLKHKSFGLESDDPKVARDLDNRGAERFKGKGVNLDSKGTLNTAQNKVGKPIKIKILCKVKNEEASKTTVPSVKSPTERVKKSPMKVIAKKRVGIKRLPSFPRIDRRESGDVDLEEYGSRAIMQSGGLNGYRPGKKDDVPTDPRAKVKRCLRLFQVISRQLLQEVESGKKLPDMEINRIDLRTAKILGELNETLNRDKPVVGLVPGVEVGDEYRYRAELSVLGLHRPPQAGIDYTMWNGIHIATSIVASGGYSDDMENENVLIYTGAGGKPTGKTGHTEPEDQKLKRGNLALKNSIETKTPVRVIHGQSTSNSGKVVMTFTYDGLYRVEKYWREKETYMVKGEPKTVAVFKFRLKRLEGQPELNWSKLKKVQRSKVREGLCFKDISLGKEKLPICVINTIDNKNPRQFQYITKTVYPAWYQKTRPKGCTCKGPCSDPKTCSCAVKNGGQIPFNFNGAIVKAKRLIYECGPMCGCPPSCYNRVSQHGIKYPLEVFKTEKRGWGVRSLSSIPSGSFVCEYIGELLRDREAEQRTNDEYLFDIGHNYDDSALWEGLLSDDGIITDEVGAPSSEEGYTIDALERGNVGRFINHSCSPNLYAQDVLFDHDDKKMPHVMFFACENIPPLKELTYHYNYGIGAVRGSDGSVKVKECYCGASECKGRLY
ncbi:histone-lysine N-methyltransferase, H3 lysine-9 specific SUVH4-like protein [Carex littledalei]|uniref:Histone-lysine N-methyltransferase, H3 lysine-9 specific SUVH4-like protein n=1 Tax=Carex littledalei TaxID=544730 RepID=A0A833V5G3_9POAL|nr:histone-lysine N-methyltransferase, H3 lysine-9 specific SUVH4-like protein [Carex littledalei]